MKTASPTSRYGSTAIVWLLLVLPLAIIGLIDTGESVTLAPWILLPSAILFFWFGARILRARRGKRFVAPFLLSLDGLALLGAVFQALAFGEPALTMWFGLFGVAPGALLFLFVHYQLLRHEVSASAARPPVRLSVKIGLAVIAITAAVSTYYSSPWTTDRAVASFFKAQGEDVMGYTIVKKEWVHVCCEVATPTYPISANKARYTVSVRRYDGTHTEIVDLTDKREDGLDFPGGSGYQKWEVFHLYHAGETPPAFN